MAGVLDKVQVGDVLMIVTPAARYLDEVVLVTDAAVRTRVAGQLKRVDGTGTGGIKGTPATKRDSRALRAERWLRREPYASNVSADALVNAAKMLGWKEKP